MTSSLVGSEMCIRDSLKIDPTNSSSTHTRAQPVAPKLRQSSARHRSKRAVSYTHMTLPTICSV
eukprot:9943593-Prorocentrum_lima.AAC.1